MRQKKKTVRRGRAYWEALVSQYDASPCGHETFAARKGVNVGTFRYWLYKVRAERSKSSRRVEPPARFLEVVSEGVGTSQPACVLRQGKAEVHFPQLFSRGLEGRIAA